ncbi:histidine kinase dimerization/phospho-acceptor domain-containing protein, partial [Pseudomonas aeruginosa]
MSHEIRTPMNAVIGILELVLQRLAHRLAQLAGQALPFGDVDPAVHPAEHPALA